MKARHDGACASSDAAGRTLENFRLLVRGIVVPVPSTNPVTK